MHLFPFFCFSSTLFPINQSLYPCRAPLHFCFVLFLHILLYFNTNLLFFLCLSYIFFNFNCQFFFFLLKCYQEVNNMNFFSKKQKVIIQFLLSFILLICGMCYNPMEADSFFSYTNNQNAASNLTQISNENINSDICTAELHGQQSTFRTLQPCSCTNNKVLLRYFFYFFIQCIQIAVRSLSLLFFLSLPKLLFKFFSLDIIISYIHNMDGKTAPLFQI